MKMRQLAAIWLGAGLLTPGGTACAISIDGPYVYTAAGVVPSPAFAWAAWLLTAAAVPLLLVMGIQLAYADRAPAQRRRPAWDGPAHFCFWVGLGLCEFIIFSLAVGQAISNMRL